MNGIIVSLAIKWCVAKLAETGAATKWPEVKAEFGAWVGALKWGDAVSRELILVGDALIDDAALACQDVDNLKGILTALAAKDRPAAERALKALVAKVAGTNPYVSALLASA